jgi:ligand-binding SRPBCC domain-containing protein
MYYELTDHFIVAADIDRTWAFFSSADNLPAITPPWLRFQILTPTPIVLGPDSVLDYRIRVMGLPVRWRTRIIDWSPPRQFIDLQIRGPYTLWHHQHTFAPVSEGVECKDRVIYRTAGKGLGRLVQGMFVRRQLLDIFRFRRKVIAERLGWVRGVQEDIEVRRLG